MLPPEAVGKNLFFASSSFWWPRAFLSWRQHHSNHQRQHLQIPLCSIFMFSSLCVIKSPSGFFLQGYMWLHLGPTWIIQDNLLMSRSVTSHLQNLCLITFQELRLYIWLGGRWHSSTYYNHVLLKVIWNNMEIPVINWKRNWNSST